MVAFPISTRTLSEMMKPGKVTKKKSGLIGKNKIILVAYEIIMQEY